MILQALKEYYDRKLETHDPKIAKFGWEWKEIQYIIVIDKEGNPKDIQDMSEVSEKDENIRSFYVPKDVERSSEIESNLLWDNLEYAVGIVPKNGSKEKTEERHKAFQNRLKEFGETDDEGICALKKFVALSLEEKLQKFEKIPVEKQKLWDNLKKDGKGFVTFKLLGADDVIVASSQFIQSYEEYIKNKKGTPCFCLVSGEYDNLAPKHYKIKGIQNGNPTGTRLVSFNKDAYSSFGKEQGANAPIGEKTVFAYTTALNLLLSKDSQNHFFGYTTKKTKAIRLAQNDDINHLFLGNTSVVFWGQEDSVVEKNLVKAFNPDKKSKEVRALFKSVHNGILLESHKKNRFYVLGLTPNNARIAVRFWHVSTIQEMAKKINDYFDDIEIFYNEDSIFLPLLELLKATAAGGEIKNIPPILEREITRAVLTGSVFPQFVLSSVIMRICADKKVSVAQAALLKAYLNRLGRCSVPLKEQTQFENNTGTSDCKSSSKGEIKVALDQNNLNIGYNLGRLFRILEDIQCQRIAPNTTIPKATIRERFYAAASCTPAVVFPNLIRLSNHHLARLQEEWKKKYFENLLGEVFSKIQDMPSYIKLEDQARFAIGYYHQKEWRSPKNESGVTATDNQEKNSETVKQ